MWVDFTRLSNGLTYADREDTAPGVAVEPGRYLVVGNYDAEPADWWARGRFARGDSSNSGTSKPRPDALSASGADGVSVFKVTSAGYSNTQQQGATALDSDPAIVTTVEAARRRQMAERVEDTGRTTSARGESPQSIRDGVRTRSNGSRQATPDGLRLLAEDGAEAAKVSIGFELASVGAMRPGEELSAVFPVPLHPVGIPHEGAYSFELLIDGVHQASIPFIAEVKDEE